MTTPGGVPNLPVGALTLDTIASKTQDMSSAAMKGRAVERFPSIFDNSTGLSAASDLTPFGILTGIWAGVNSLIANADPADVQSPEDLPALVLDFIESLPVIGQFVGLLEAILGTYTGDDTVLLEVQTIFAPIRAIVDALTSLSGGTSGLGSFFPDLLGLLGNPTGLGTGSPSIGSLGSIPILGPIFSLFGGASNATQAGNFGTSILSLLGNPAGILTGSPTVPGLGSIPILGPVFGLFGGATNATQAGNFGTNLLSLLGGPTLTTTPGSFNTNTAATNFINSVLNPTGLLASVSAIVNAITGSTGSLTNLTSWTNDLTSLLGSPTGLGSGTVTPGALGSTPLLAPLQSLINGVVGGSGNPLSALISSLTGTASTASTANTNASSALSNFTTLINGVVGGTGNPLSALISSLTGTASATSTNSTNIGSLITNLFGGSSILTQVQPGAVGGVTAGASLLNDVQSALNGLFGGITKLSNSTTSQSDMAAAVSSQADTVTGTSATMEQILAALGSGTPDSDDFERTSSSSLGANWSVVQSGSGTLATPNGHDANFSGSGNIEYVARKTDKAASTDHQTVTMVLATAIPSYPLFTPLPYGGNNDLWLRMSAFTTFATRTGLRFRINSQAPYQATWFIHWVNSGTETQLATGSLSIPSAGASVAFEVGVGGNMLAYQARVAGSPVANFTDSTSKGLGNRYRGFGGKGATGIGTNQGTANLQQWTAQG